MRRFGLIAPVAAFVLASSAAALGEKSYRLFAAAQQRPPAGTTFSVSAHGFAAHKARLYLYLDRKPCRSTWASEAKRVNARTFTAGESYFLSTHKTFITHRETGQFYKAFTARAGSKAEREYACAYLTTQDSHGRYTVTAARASGKYTVT